MDHKVDLVIPSVDREYLLGVLYRIQDEAGSFAEQVAKGTPIEAELAGRMVTNIMFDFDRASQGISRAVQTTIQDHIKAHLDEPE